MKNNYFVTTQPLYVRDESKHYAYTLRWINKFTPTNYEFTNYEYS
mgnify:CR=1 FL=1